MIVQSSGWLHCAFTLLNLFVMPDGRQSALVGQIEPGNKGLCSITEAPMGAAEFFFFYLQTAVQAKVQGIMLGLQVVQVPLLRLNTFCL